MEVDHIYILQNVNNQKAIINPQINDDKCFQYALTCIKS